jgi:hypothetical protein
MKCENITPDILICICWLVTREIKVSKSVGPVLWQNKELSVILAIVIFLPRLVRRNLIRSTMWWECAWKPYDEYKEIESLKHLIPDNMEVPYLII